MSQEPPPPVVTISDPNRPGGLGDVIDGGSGAEPWRPSRTATRRAMAVLLVLAVAAVPVTVVAVRQHDRRLDARAAAAVKLGPLTNEGANVSDNGVVPFSLLNSGPDPVRVLSAHIDREGYPTQGLDVSIVAGASGVLDIALPKPCPAQVSPYSRPRVLVVTVRTVRGTVVTRRVSVGDDYGFGYQESLRTFCGFLTANEAIASNVVHVEERPRLLVLSLNVENRARQAWDITRVLALPGLTASTPLPIHLDAAKGANSVTGAGFEVTLAVSSCTLARASTRTDATSDVLSPGLTLLTGRDAAEHYFDPEVQAAVEHLVERACP